MSIFHHLIERVWDGYLTLKHHIERYPDNDSIKKDKDNWSKDYKRTVTKCNTLGEELLQKRDLINTEIITIKKDSEDLAVLKEKLLTLSELMDKYASGFRSMGGGGLGQPFRKDYLKFMSEKIHEFNDLLNTSHNLLMIINKKHRLLQKEEKELEK